MVVTPEEWTAILRSEYLQGFVRQGGAAVKFCVPADGDLREFSRSLLPGAAHGEGYAFAFVDAACTKVHQIDKVFFEIARQIDWDGLAKTYVRHYFRSQGYRFQEEGERFNIRDVAALNRFEEMQFRNDVKSGIQKKLFNDFGMSQEFRLALARLCLNQFNQGDPEDFLSNAVREWLKGELRMISSLKDALIFQKITKYNARHMLYSLTHWIRVNDRSGLVLLLDMAGCFTPRQTMMETGSLSYTMPMVLDAYELLRQFVDGTSDMEGLLMVVTAPQDLLVDEKRGLDRYDALKMRIWNEVRDRQRQNPFSALVRLSESHE